MATIKTYLTNVSTGQFAQFTEKGEDVLLASIGDELVLNMIVTAPANNGVELDKVIVAVGAASLSFPMIGSFTQVNTLPTKPYFPVEPQSVNTDGELITPFQFVGTGAGTYTGYINQELQDLKKSIYIMKLPLTVLNSKINVINTQFPISVTTQNVNDIPVTSLIKLRITEPDIIFVSSIITNPMPILPGGTIQYEVGFRSRAANTYHSTAYDVVANFEAFQNPLFESIQLTPPPTGWTQNANQPLLAYNQAIPAGTNINNFTFRITATLRSTIPDQNFAPIVSIKWNSQNPNPIPKSTAYNNISNITNGRNGTDGSVGVNNYFVQTILPLQRLVMPSVSVVLRSPASAVIGSTVSFATVVTVPPGLYAKLTIQQTSSPNLTYIRSDITKSVQDGLFPVNFNGSYTSTEPGELFTINNLNVSSVDGMTFAVIASYTATAAGEATLNSTVEFLSTYFLTGYSQPVFIEGTEAEGIAILTCRKAVTNYTANANGTATLTYDIEVTNVGQVTSDPAVLSDTYPANTIVTSTDWSIPVGNTVTRPIPALLPGISKTYSITFQLASTTTLPIFVNKITTTLDSVDYNVFDTFTIPATAEPVAGINVIKQVLAVNLTPAGTGTITYTILVRNLGTLTSNTGFIVDNLPVDTAVFGNDGWLGTTGMIVQLLAPIQPGQSRQFALTISLGLGFAGTTVTNSAFAMIDGIPSNVAFADVEIPPATTGRILCHTQDHSPIFQLSKILVNKQSKKHLEFTVTVRNISTKQSKAAMLNATLSDAVTLHVIPVLAVGESFAIDMWLDLPHNCDKEVYSKMFIVACGHIVCSEFDVIEL
jgi:hypothetical protein